MAGSSFDLELGPERSLHLCAAGEGRDIVLIHGALTTHRDWLDGPFDRLAAEGRAIALDRPGHGRSRRQRFEASPRAQAAQIREGLEAFGAERPVLVGHSFGALVALAFAEQFPEALSHLVLVAPIGFPDFRPLEQGWFGPRSTPVFGPLLARMNAGTLDRPVIEMFHQLMFAPYPPPERWKRGYPWERILDPGATVAEGEDMAALHPLSPGAHLDIGSIRTPAHIVAAADDAVVPGDHHARRLSRLLQDARLQELNEAGHMLHHSRTDVLIDAVREALTAAPVP